MTCSLPTEEDLKAIYWMSQRQWYDIIDDKIVFKPDTPKEVLESYAME